MDIMDGQENLECQVKVDMVNRVKKDHLGHRANLVSMEHPENLMVMALRDSVVLLVHLVYLDIAVFRDNLDL